MPLTDKDIIRLYRQDHESGLKAVFDKYYISLCVFAGKYIGEHEPAEDIVQSLFVKFWEEGSLMDVKSSLRSYLFFSVRNACVNYLEKQRRSRKELESYKTEIEFHIAAEELPDPVVLERLEKHIENLPERCRLAFQLVVFKSFSYKQAADELNISVNTVKTQLSRAMRQLREKMSVLIFF